MLLLIIMERISVAIRIERFIYEVRRKSYREVMLVMKNILVFEFVLDFERNTVKKLKTTFSQWIKYVPLHEDLS